MARRLFDLILAALGLALTAPLFLVIALGIKLSSPGPVFYRAERVGKDARTFAMYKFRTMHAVHTLKSPITAERDPRVFPFGAWLRLAKLDELPQCLNILKGDMAVVGPRPEDPGIVARYYAPEHIELLRVLPGLTSPGTLYDYGHGEALLQADDPERHYVEKVLPLRLALDLVYVREASLRYDLALVARTLGLMARRVSGAAGRGKPPELARAQDLLVPLRQPVASHAIGYQQP